ALHALDALAVAADRRRPQLDELHRLLGLARLDALLLRLAEPGEHRAERRAPLGRREGLDEAVALLLARAAQARRADLAERGVEVALAVVPGLALVVLEVLDAFGQRVRGGARGL